MDKKTKLYHFSTVPDIKELKPAEISGRQAFVYATDCIPLGLLFAIKGFRDLDGETSGRGPGKQYIPYYMEAHPHGLDKYKGVSCYMYEVDPTTFEEGRTSWSEDLVSEKPVKVLSCTKINDVYKELVKYEKQGKIKIYRYKDSQNDPEMKKRVHDHAKRAILHYESILFLNESDFLDPQQFKRCKELQEFISNNFPEIVKEIYAEVVKKYEYISKVRPEILEEIIDKSKTI